MMLKLKLQDFGHLMQRVDSLEKTDTGRDWGQEEKGTTEVEMAGWHHWLDGRESEWTPGVGDGQGGLVCCNSWGRKDLDMTERLNWTELCSLHYINENKGSIRGEIFVTGLWWVNPGPQSCFWVLGFPSLRSFFTRPHHLSDSDSEVLQAGCLFLRCYIFQFIPWNLP